MHLIRILSNILMVSFSSDLIAFPNDQICRFIYMSFDITMEKQSSSHLGFIFVYIVFSYAGSIGLEFSTFVVCIQFLWLTFFKKSFVAKHSCSS
ncbi:hypothetical protein Bca101_031794 [Brassica carinata]